MKNLLVICMAVYFIAQASGQPESQMRESFQDIFDNIKQKVQEALNYTQEAASHALETAKNMMQNGLQTAREAAQRGVYSEQNNTEFDQTTVEKFDESDELDQ